jgi:hypothetical protein
MLLEMVRIRAIRVPPVPGFPADFQALRLDLVKFAASSGIVPPQKFGVRTTIFAVTGSIRLSALLHSGQMSAGITCDTAKPHRTRRPQRGEVPMCRLRYGVSTSFALPSLGAARGTTCS